MLLGSLVMLGSTAPVYQHLADLPPGEVSISATGGAFLRSGTPNGGAVLYWMGEEGGLASQECSHPFAVWSADNRILLSDHPPSVSADSARLPDAVYALDGTGQALAGRGEPLSMAGPESTTISLPSFEDSHGTEVFPDSEIFTTVPATDALPTYRYVGMEGLVVVNADGRRVVVAERGEMITSFYFDRLNCIVGFYGAEFTRVDLNSGERQSWATFDPVTHTSYAFNLVPGTDLLVRRESHTSSDEELRLLEDSQMDVIMLDGTVVESIPVRPAGIGSPAGVTDIHTSPTFLTFLTSGPEGAEVRVFQRIEQ